MRIASYNVENLFARPKALNTADSAEGRAVLDAYKAINALMEETIYTETRKRRMLALLEELDIYYKNSRGAVRRRESKDPQWAWLRKNRGKFDRQPEDERESIEIVAGGRGDWIGWVELATEQVDEVATRMTAKVIGEVNPDILAVVEAEDRPSLVRFNSDLLSGQFSSVMLIDGNDERGIDVGIMTTAGASIGSMRSNVELRDAAGLIFSRDCPQYQVDAADGGVLHILVNHFKSQSGGGGPQRARQAQAVRRITEKLVDAGSRVVVLGDLNEGPKALNEPPENLRALFDPDGPLLDCYGLDGFDVGQKPGTYDSCGLSNRLDYILISKNLLPAFQGGGVFRKGVWGSRKTRPSAWETYEEIENSSQQASDHALIYVDLEL